MGPIRSPGEALDRGPADAERLERRTLEDELEAGPIRLPRALAILGEIADALDARRAAGAATASIEPSAVLTGDDDVRLGEPAAERSDQYVSPEWILGRDEGAAADVYSLTAVLYHCLTGSVPFPRGRGRAVRFWHLHAPRPSATQLRPGLPLAVDHVIARGMAIDPAARYPTARALIEDARAALGPAAAADSARAVADARPTGVAPTPRTAEGGGRRVSGALLALAAVAVAVAAGAAGFVVAGGPDRPRQQPSVARAGSIELRAPAGWRRSATPSTGLELAHPLSLTPNKGAGATLVAGVAGAGASVALLARADASPPAGELVSLGDVRARRYRATRLPGLAEPATLYVTPASTGIATVACLAGRARATTGSMADCEQVAGSLRLVAPASAPVAASDRDNAALRRALQRLNSARARYRARVERAATAAGQAAAAGALARAHLREERALRSLRLTGLARPGGRAAVRALARAADAYAAAARAAASGDRDGYAVARRAAAEADADLRRALALLRVVGYGV